jgi:hypothetical protein
MINKVLFCCITLLVGLLKGFCSNEYLTKEQHEVIKIYNNTKHPIIIQTNIWDVFTQKDKERDLLGLPAEEYNFNYIVISCGVVPSPRAHKYNLDLDFDYEIKYSYLAPDSSFCLEVPFVKVCDTTHFMVAIPYWYADSLELKEFDVVKDSIALSSVVKQGASDIYYMESNSNLFFTRIGAKNGTLIINKIEHE